MPRNELDDVTATAVVDSGTAESSPVTTLVAHDDAAVIRFDTFLFTAAATVLITRAYLAATGYPKIGGHSELHLAHVLWGGLLLAVGATIMLVRLGSQAKFQAALVAGIGFGLFIDEVGKFVTRNVNYFFRPAIAIIYAVLIGFYLVGRELLLRRSMTPVRVKSMAADAYLDQTLGELTSTQRALVLTLLEQVADRTDPMVRTLDAALQVPPLAHRRTVADVITGLRERTSRAFHAVLHRRWCRRVLFVVLVVQAVETIFSASVDVASHNDVSSGRGVTAIAALSSGTVAAVLIMTGLLVRRLGHPLGGLQIVRTGLMVNLLLSDLFRFASSQFGALAAFLVHVVLILSVNASINELDLSHRPVGQRSVRSPGR